MQMKKYGYNVTPNLVGAVDGFIAEIGNLDESEFKNIGIPRARFHNKKGFPGLNCIASVDAWTRLNCLEIRWPGSTNDIVAYNMSNFLAAIKKMKNKYHLALDEAFKSIHDGKHITPFSGGEIKEAQSSGNLVRLLLSLLHYVVIIIIFKNHLLGCCFHDAYF